MGGLRCVTSEVHSASLQTACTSVCRPEIVLDNAILRENLRHRTICDLLSMVQYDDTICEVANSLYDVFDDDNRDAVGAQLSDDPNDFGYLVVREPSHHFVEQQQLRTGGHRPRNLEPFALGNVQLLGLAVTLVVESDNVQKAIGLLSRCLDAGISAVPRAEKCAQHHAFAGGQSLKGLY